MVRQVQDNLSRTPIKWRRSGRHVAVAGTNSRSEIQPGSLVRVPCFGGNESSLIRAQFYYLGSLFLISFSSAFGSTL